MNNLENTQPSPSQYRWSNYLSIHTLQGRMSIFVIIFICLLSLFSIYVLIQNQQSNALTQQLEKSDTRKVLLLTHMLEGVEQVVTMQQAYLLENNPNSESQQDSVWSRLIEEPFHKLDSTQKNLKRIK